MKISALLLSALLPGASLFAEAPCFTFARHERPAASIRPLALFDRNAQEFPESIARDPRGDLYLTLPFTGVIKRVTPAGAVSTFATIDDAFLLGATFDPFGELTVAGAAGVWKVSRSGAARLFSAVPGHESLNDLVYDRAGNLYVTDSVRFVVWKIDMHGRASIWSDTPELAATKTVFPATIGANGIAFSPDQRTLYVGNTSDGRLLAFRVGWNGAAEGPRVIAEDDALIGLDALRTTPDGTLYAVNNLRRQILRLDRNGNRAVIAAGAPQNFPTSLVFGDLPGLVYICNNGDAFLSETPGVPGVLVGYLR